MWLLLGVAAIVTAICNVIWSARNQEAKWFRFISLSFTALTLCEFYGAGAAWVINEDWSALMDVLPTMSRTLWILTIGSILLNSISLFNKSDK